MKATFATALLFLFLASGCRPAESPSPTPSTDESADILPSVSAATDAKQASDESLHHSRRNAITTAVENVAPAVVSISVTERVQQRGGIAFDPFQGFFIEPGKTREFNSFGTGFLISAQGHIITNQHVVGTNPSRIVVTLSDGESYEAKLLGADEYGDLAVLKIEGTSFPFIPFGDSDEAIVGEWCIAVGNPFGLFQDGKPSVTVGVISAVKRDFRPDPQEPRVYLDMIQTDAAINRGNSGGPLVNSLGEVIGVNTFIYTGGTSSGFVGLSFAIPSNTVKKIARQLMQSGTVKLDFDPGFEIRPITRETAYQYNLPYIQGVFVFSVNKAGPAFDAGILPGDVLVKVNDTRIYSHTHYRALMREFKEGDAVTMTILRKNRLYEAKVFLRASVKSMD